MSVKVQANQNIKIKRRYFHLKKHLPLRSFPINIPDKPSIRLQFALLTAKIMLKIKRMYLMMFIPQDSMMFFCLCLSLKLIKFLLRLYSESITQFAGVQKVKHIVDLLAFRATAVRSMGAIQVVLLRSSLQDKFRSKSSVSRGRQHESNQVDARSSAAL